MWHTPDGLRVLEDLEGEVARLGLQTAVDLIEIGMDAGDPWVFEVAQFDALTPEQQLALLAEVGRALWDRSIRSPELSAIHEAAVYVIFRGVLLAIEFEIDGESFTNASVREMVCELLLQTAPDDWEDEDGLAIDPDCRDMREWEFAVECLADGILWDRDFELDDLIVDSSPERAEFVKSYLGIDDDYFTAIAADPTDLTEVKRTLRILTRQKPR